MTTIVYDYKAGLVAVDSRVTQDTAILSDNFEKFRFIENELWVFSGCTSDFDSFVSVCSGATLENKEELECAALVIKDGDVWEYGLCDKIPFKEKLTYNYSKGSGLVWVLAALDFGLNARKAVEYAITKDCKSGGKVHVFDVKTGKKKR